MWITNWESLGEMLEYLKYRIFAGRRLNEKSKTVKIEAEKIWRGMENNPWLNFDLYRRGFHLVIESTNSIDIFS